MMGMISYWLLVFSAILYKGASANIGKWTGSLSGWFERYNMFWKILKIESLLNEDIDIDEDIKIICPGGMEIMKLKTNIDSIGISRTHSCFRPMVEKLLYILQRYIWKIKSSSCCKMRITGFIDMENPDHEYLIILNPESCELCVWCICCIDCSRKYSY